MQVIKGMVHENIGSMFLYLVILFAGIDYQGILDYCLKAFLGGTIWFAYKIIAEYYLIRLRKTQKEKHKQQQTKR